MLILEIIYYISDNFTRVVNEKPFPLDSGLNAVANSTPITLVNFIVDCIVMGGTWVHPSRIHYLSQQLKQKHHINNILFSAQF
jgi:hypothetical protein